jgi:hypothetical protein
MPKITEFDTETTLADDDIFVVIDVSDVLPSGMSDDGTNKIITASNAANSLASKITSVPTIVSTALTAKANIASPTFTGNVVLPSTTTIGSISSTELSYLDGVTSAIQTQLNTISSAVNTESPTFTGTVTAASFVGPLTGNSSTATTLQNARAIACSGDVVGTTNFNGSANVSIATTLSDGVVTPAKLSTGAPTWNSGGTLSATLFSGPLTGIASGNIKQGGGTSQGSNTIYVGWNSPKLRVQVDNTDFASTWPIDISGNAGTATALTQPYTLATAQVSTSGTSIDFTGIPSWVKRITVMFNGVSNSGGAEYLIQLGTSSGFDGTGYISHSSDRGGDDVSTEGFIVSRNVGAGDTSNGIVTICKFSGNSWISSGNISRDVVVASSTGAKTLSNVLTQIRVINEGGAQTFDAGSINISYE